MKIMIKKFCSTVLVLLFLVAFFAPLQAEAAPPAYAPMTRVPRLYDLLGRRDDIDVHPTLSMSNNTHFTVPEFIIIGNGMWRPGGHDPLIDFSSLPSLSSLSSGSAHHPLDTTVTDPIHLTIALTGTTMGPSNINDPTNMHISVHGALAGSVSGNTLAGIPSASTADNVVESEGWLLGGLSGGTAVSTGGTSSATRNFVDVRNGVIGRNTSLPGSGTPWNIPAIGVAQGGTAQLTSSSSGNISATENIVVIREGTEAVSTAVPGLWGTLHPDGRLQVGGGTGLAQGAASLPNIFSATIEEIGSPSPLRRGWFTLPVANAPSNAGGGLVAAYHERPLHVHAVPLNSGTMLPRVRGAVGGAVFLQANSTVIGGARANDNEVWIVGGTVHGEGWIQSSPVNHLTYGVHGGVVRFMGAGVNASSGTGEAIGNTVTLHGGWIHENVYGGRIHFDYAATTATGEATYNTVNITGGQGDTPLVTGSTPSGRGLILHGADIYSGSDIYGGLISRGNTANEWYGMHSITGNTLNVRSEYLPFSTADNRYTGLRLGSVRNFQIMNFYLPHDIAPDDIILTSSVEPVTLEGRSRIFNQAKVDLRLLSTPITHSFVYEDEIILIENVVVVNANGFPAAFEEHNAPHPNANIDQYEFLILVENGNLIARLVPPPVFYYPGGNGSNGPDGSNGLRPTSVCQSGGGNGCDAGFGIGALVLVLALISRRKKYSSLI